MKNENKNENRKASLTARKAELKKELDRLSEERRDAWDRCDQEEVKAITKITHPINLEIVKINKALREFAA